MRYASAIVLAGCGVLAMACTAMAIGMGAGAQAGSLASPLYGVTIPDGYRRWQLVAPAQEAPPLDELRATLGNDVAIRAYARGAGPTPFPDGTVLVKLAWKHVPSPEFELASIPGAATTVQVMVKDSKKYAATGGWGYGRFVDGQPVDEAQHRTCFACHQSRAKARDYVFTRYAP